jgi:hypothetical protein
LDVEGRSSTTFVHRDLESLLDIADQWRDELMARASWKDLAVEKPPR